MDHFKDRGVELLAGDDGEIRPTYVLELALSCPICREGIAVESRVAVAFASEKDGGRVPSPTRVQEAAKAGIELVSALAAHLRTLHSVRQDQAWRGAIGDVLLRLAFEKFNVPTVEAPKVVL